MAPPTGRIVVALRFACPTIGWVSCYVKHSVCVYHCCAISAVLAVQFPVAGIVNILCLFGSG